MLKRFNTIKQIVEVFSEEGRFNFKFISAWFVTKLKEIKPELWHKIISFCSVLADDPPPTPSLPPSPPEVVFWKCKINEDLVELQEDRTVAEVESHHLIMTVEATFKQHSHSWWKRTTRDYYRKTRPQILWLYKKVRVWTEAGATFHISIK